MKKIIFAVTAVALGLGAYIPLSQAASYTGLDIQAQHQPGRIASVRRSITLDEFRATIEGDTLGSNAHSLQDHYDREENIRSQW